MGSSFTAPNEMRNSSRWYKAEIEGAAPECDKSNLNKKHSSVAIVADVNRCHQIKRTKFSAHTGRTLAMSLDFSSLFWIFIAIMVLQPLFIGRWMPCDARRPSVRLKSHTRRVSSR